jgi:hypothetical protein
MTQRPGPIGPRKPDIHKLLRGIIRSFVLSLLGSWGLIVSRLNVFHYIPEELGPRVWFYVDLASLSVAIFGILSVLYYNSLLSPRLRRLSQFGESDW